MSTWFSELAIAFTGSDCSATAKWLELSTKHDIDSDMAAQVWDAAEEDFLIALGSILFRGENAEDQDVRVPACIIQTFENSMNYAAKVYGD